MFPLVAAESASKTQAGQRWNESGNDEWRNLCENTPVLETGSWVTGTGDVEMPRRRRSAAQRIRRRMKLKRRVGQAAAVRRDVPVPDLKALLASAPLEGIDLERSRDPGREVDL